MESFALKKYIIFYLTEFLFLVLFQGGATMSNQENPSGYKMTCIKIDRDLEITGKIDDPLWQTAEFYDLKHPVNGQPGRFKSQVKVLYNDRYLYIAFRCEDTYVWGTLLNRDEAIYTQECVEAFINPSGSPFHYYEINVSPKNVVFDACILNNRTIDRPSDRFLGLTDFDIKKLKTKVWIQGKADVPNEAELWSVEYAIPFDELFGAHHNPPRAGDEWRVNFYRIDAPAPAHQEFYAWSPTGKIDFHRPWKFGVLVFN
jgi:hypothetical protein